MRIVFMGTGDIAIPAFRSLIRHSDLAGLVTQPDRPVGRHQVLTAPAIKNIAREAGIPVLQPHSLRSPDALSNLRRLNPDLIVVMAYGQILSQEVIDMAPMGCINAHASLLPRHRGAACIQSAIKSGDAETGITIMHIVRKLDAGDIIAQISTPLECTETGGSLHDKLARMTPDVLLPVPLSTARQRQRGYNQCAMLGQWLSDRLDIPCQAHWLLRTLDTPAQQALDAKTRKRNLLNAFALAPDAQVRGLHVALVDDVLTTGATAQSLALVLLKAGAKRVDVYCLARTPKPDGPA